MKQVVKFLSYFLTKTLFLIILTLHIAEASYNNYENDAAIYNVIANRGSVTLLESNGPNNYDSLTNLDTSAAQNNMRIALSNNSDNIPSARNTITANQRKAKIESSNQYLVNQIDRLHSIMLTIARQHQQQVQSSGEKAFAPNIKIALLDLLKSTTSKNNFISSHAIHYIARSLSPSTNTSKSPYDGFMRETYCPVGDSKLLSELFPDKTTVSHLEIIQKLEELEQKEMHGSITAREEQQMIELSTTFSHQLIKFIEKFGYRLTIEERDLEEVKQMADDHLDEIHKQLSEVTFKESLDGEDYCHPTTARGIFQHENDMTRNNNVARNNAKISNSLSENPYYR